MSLSLRNHACIAATPPSRGRAVLMMDGPLRRRGPTPQTVVAVALQRAAMRAPRAAHSGRDRFAQTDFRPGPYVTQARGCIECSHATSPFAGYSGSSPAPATPQTRWRGRQVLAGKDRRDGPDGPDRDGQGRTGGCDGPGGCVCMGHMHAGSDGHPGSPAGHARVQPHHPGRPVRHVQGLLPPSGRRRVSNTS